MGLDDSILTLADIASKLKVNTDTVRRLFSTEPGVIVLSSPAPGRRAYRTLRVPVPVLLRVLTRLTRLHKWTPHDLDEPIFTLDEIAHTLKIDLASVRRLFSREPGVLVICFPRPATRTYRTIRVPTRALHNVIDRLSLHDDGDPTGSQTRFSVSVSHFSSRRLSLEAPTLPPDPPPAEVYSLNAAGTALVRPSSTHIRHRPAKFPYP